MATTNGGLTVNLGPQRRVVEERLAAGSYATADEVIQAALRALEREESETNAWLVALAEEALVDPRPSVPAEEVFGEIRAKYERGRRSSSPVDDEAGN